MSNITRKDNLFIIELKDVRGINIKKVNARGSVFSSQEVDLKLTDTELYELYIECQKLFGGLLF